MIFDIKQVNERYPIAGVMHVGAFAGEELKSYRRLGLDNTMMFEPQPKLYNLVQDRLILNETIHNVALGSEECEKEMYVSWRAGGILIVTGKQTS